jgi:hypothetical protein
LLWLLVLHTFYAKFQNDTSSITFFHRTLWPIETQKHDLQKHIETHKLLSQNNKF